MKAPGIVRAAVLAALAVATPALAQQKQAPPAPAAPRDFRLPTKTSFALPNGVEVTMVPFGMTPKVNVQVVLRTGNANEAANEIWLADVTADLMQEGTTTRTAAQVAREFAAMGGSLNVAVRSDESSFGTDVLSERAAEAVRLLADVVRNPRFPESELPRIRATRLRQLSIAKSRPQSLADERFAQVLYGDHPYGRTFPTEAMLNGYTVESVRRFYQDNFGAARARIYVAGVFDRAGVEQAIRTAFGDWPAGSPPATLPAPRQPTTREVALIDRPRAPQSTLYVGLPIIDPSKPDWIPLQVTNALLGGSFGSRITSNIREQKGYTYSPFSTVRAHYRDAHWVEIADVTTSATGASLKEIFAEIERLQKEPPPQGELRGIQNYIAGVFTLQNGSREGLINRLDFVDFHGLGDDYLTSYVKRVYDVTPADVQRITTTYIRPDAMSIVVVGDKATVESQLAPYRPVVP